MNKVRRLTPIECERLQGFPQKKKWDLLKMNKDEYIAWNLAEGNIIAEPKTGKVYGTRGPGGIKLTNPRELKGTDVNGYLVVNIRNGSVKAQCRIHRIIWISQNGVIPDGYCVDHINSDKTDNRIDNLQLLTPKENSTKAAKDGLYKTGLEHGRTILDPELKGEIVYLYEHTDLTQRQLAEVYGISKSRINQIIKEVGWTLIGEPEEVEVKDYDIKYDDEGNVVEKTLTGTHKEIEYFYTDSNGKRKKCSDSARYKALGNSIATPYWFVLLRRISAMYERPATLGSLFDGIGGFPMCWEKCNGQGTAIWASEIEDFCVQVTKAHFGED